MEVNGSLQTYVEFFRQLITVLGSTASKDISFYSPVCRLFFFSLLFNTIDEVIGLNKPLSDNTNSELSAQWDIRVENQINFINLMFCGCRLILLVPRLQCV